MKIHILNKESDYKNQTLCNSKSWYKEFAKRLSEVTCRTCKAYYQIQKGVIDEIPFGGRYNKDGELRENDGSQKRWKKVIDSKLCPFCKESKPIEKFRKTAWGGRLTKCNKCMNQDFKESKVQKYV